MGWFGPTYVTRVGTSVSRVIPDKGLPNHRKTGLLRALLKDGDIPENIVGSLVTNVVNNVDQMYNYARTRYTHGLPSGEYGGSGGVARGDFFPFVYFRFNKLSETANKSTPSYLTSKKLVKYLGMDFDSIAEAIDENPDIADVEQAILMMSVPAYSQDPLEMRYLFEFYKNIQEAGVVKFLLPSVSLDEQWRIEMADAPLVPNTLAINIKDLRFKMALGNNGVFKEFKTGNVAAPGKYACDVLPITILAKSIVAESEGSYKVTYVPKTVMQHRYLHQTSLGKYTEIRVRNIRMNYYVFGDYLSTADGLEPILLVPIDKTITDRYSVSQRETLYSRSLHFVFNSRTVTKLKWYQTDEFMMFVMFIGAVITIFTYGAPINAFLGAVVAGSTVAITTTLLVIAGKLIIATITAYVLNLFVQAVGIKVALIIAILAVLAGAYLELTVDIAQCDLPGAPWAERLLSLGNGLSKASSVEVQSLMGDLLGEVNDFQTLMGTKYEELEVSNKLLESHSWLSPLTFFGETPDDFYNRTAHSGNIGITSIGAISSYVDIALTLPKIDETVGGNLNEYT